ncbi:shikimate dehydrogenase [Devosia aurantiaca]|uniref:shikimate dehydrogenase n=1 Tax=Devosia aurantiaca TaxID=2714858 RepID=UPI002E2E6853|nr:shikimate dehydrogenase [Devosia aurantiaca]
MEARRFGSAATRQVIVGLVGRGIQASRTPRMHELEGQRIGFPYAYELIDFDALGLDDSDLPDILELAQALGFVGLNVTYPFKQAVIPLLEHLSPEADGIGAVNTVVLGQGQRVGHNTDAWGFAESFREGLPGVDLGHVAQFGAGGAGAAVSHALLTLGVERLTICDTEADRAQTLAQRLSQRFGDIVSFRTDSSGALAGVAGIVNTTPVGMDKFPGLPFDARLLQPDLWVAEVIYFPPETALLQQARALGCRTLAGMGMAVYQAVKAFELFTGIAPDRSAMTAHFHAAA